MSLAPGAPRSGRAPTLPGNIQPTSTQLFHHVLCRRELSSLGRSALCLAPAGRTPWAPTWSLDLGTKLAFFGRGALTQGSPATACKGLPWLFASSARASFATCFSFSQARRWAATLRRGPIGGARCPRPCDPSMAPGPLRHTPAAFFSMGSTVLT